MAEMGIGGSSGASLGGSSSMVATGGSSGPASSSGGPTSTGSNQRYLILNDPFRDPELLESMSRQWQQLTNWKSATVEGLTWEGTEEENTSILSASVIMQ
jgi:hypothetical protein